MTHQTMTIPFDPADRRIDVRHDVHWPCKIWHLRARKYYPGWTSNCSKTGVKLTLDRPLDLDIGDAVRIDVADPDHPGIVSQANMAGAVVVRAAKDHRGRTEIAVMLDHPRMTLQPPAARRAA
ncbi:MAG: hypothetical protein AAF432_14510 [Planctomycetota bacterium]